jgi:hypothetical protein
MRITASKADNEVIYWLLEPENPSVRYRALTELLDRPGDDPDVLEAGETITQLPLVNELFSRQHPDGHWGEDAAKPYTAEGTLGVLSLLWVLRAPPDERTSAGCDSMLRNLQNECGGFSLIRKTRSGIFPCTTGEHLPMLVYFGFGGDERVRSAYQFLVEDILREGALNCSRYEHRECLWGAIASLNGLSALPPGARQDGSNRAVEKLASTLLDAAYDFESEHKRWLTFGVPRHWDLLSALKVLALHGYARDVRFKRLFQLVLEKRDGEGRWICGSVSRTWPLEKRGQPSKWVTLDGMWVSGQALSG